MKKGRNNQSVQFSLHAKLVLNVSVVGQKSSGKSSLIVREVKDTFGKLSKTSEGFQFYSKTFKKKNQDVSLQIWDTVGKSQYKSMTRNFFRQAAAIIVVYEKIDNLTKEIDQLCKQLQEFAHDCVKLCIIRTKIDVKPVSQEEKDQLKEITELKFPKTIFYTGEVSARKNSNVHQYFQELVEKLYRCYQQDEQFREAINGQQKNSFILSCDPNRQQEKNKRGCC